MSRATSVLVNVTGTIFLYYMISACANVGVPTGGQKDTSPPVVVQSSPPDKSLNFNGDVIRITFDEFIQLKNISQQLIVSPPFKDKPEVKLRNKTLVISLNNPLRDSTTYTLYFGDAVADLNEGNIFRNFRFVFSTGNKIDSLKTGGTLVNAFTLKPEKDVMVMLYADKSDSAPLKDMPLYVSRTGDKGEFLITNIRKGVYKVFALKDNNANFRYDQLSESIAFSDSIITPSAKTSVLYDTVRSKTDSIKKDSVTARTVTSFSPLDLQLRLFDETGKRLYMKKPDRPEKYRCNFYFSLPLEGSMEISPDNFMPEKEWHITEINRNRDSVICWITDTILANRDTVKMILKYLKTDSAGRLEQASDTVKLGFIPKHIKKHGKPDRVVFNTGCNVQKSKFLDLNQNICFNFSVPLAVTDTSGIRLFRLSDTLKIPVKFSFYRDSFQLRRYYISTNWEENTRYKLLIPAGVFHDISGSANDTVKAEFAIQKKEYYGSIIIRLSDLNTNGIVQLLNEKNVVLKEIYTYGNRAISFEYLAPASYRLKFIFDTNNNKKWDTGNYAGKIQPEKVLIYKEDVKVRSNWDVELNWVLR